MSEPDNRMESELNSIDRALETGVVTAPGPLERELEELALALTAEASEPDAGFADELGERVRDGFPRRGKGAVLARSPIGLRSSLRAPRLAFGALPKLRRPPMGVLAGAASLIAALAVVVAL